MINKIKNRFEVSRDIKAMEITIKDPVTGEVIYQFQSKGGLMCTVEEIKEINVKEGFIEATHQILAWGDILVQGHCMMMLRDNMKKNMANYIEEAERKGFDVPKKYKDAVKRYASQ